MEAEDNFFEGLFENRLSKITAAICSFLFSLFTFTLILFIIWFEKYGSDLKRIFINRIVSSICWTALAGIVLVQIPEFLIFFNHPLPKNFCLLILLLKNALFLQVVLFLDGIIIAKYIFIF
jgi:hypothetical protein